MPWKLSTPLLKSGSGLKTAQCEQINDLLPQGYWQTPPANRAEFLERANHSHHAKSEAMAA
jgi:hypothetical protein